VKPELLQLGKFLIVGCSNTAVSAAIFWSWRQFALDPIATAAIAQAVAYTAGIVWSYTCNRRWTFHGRDGRSRLMHFVALQLALLVGTSLTLGVLVDYGGAPVALTWGSVMVVATAANYLGQRHWVFRVTPAEKKV